MNDETAKPEMSLIRIDREVQQDVIENAFESAVQQAVEKKKDAYAVIDLIEIGADQTRVVLTGDARVATALKRALAKRYRTAKIVASRLSEKHLEALPI